MNIFDFGGGLCSFCYRHRREEKKMSIRSGGPWNTRRKSMRNMWCMKTKWCRHSVADRTEFQTAHTIRKSKGTDCSSLLEKFVYKLIHTNVSLRTYSCCQQVVKELSKSLTTSKVYLRTGLVFQASSHHLNFLHCHASCSFCVERKILH